jgi:hypothetical protein
MSEHRLLIDRLRIVMYGGGGNLLEEIVALGKIVSDYDNVPYDENKNRLTQLFLTNSHRYDVEFLNGDG